MARTLQRSLPLHQLFLPHVARFLPRSVRFELHASWSPRPGHVPTKEVREMALQSAKAGGSYFEFDPLCNEGALVVFQVREHESPRRDRLTGPR
jgi:hypothetical protein